MIWPDVRVGALPSNDLPADIRDVYEEAQLIGSKSPRSAVALLRLCLQHLCDHLEPGSADINSKIGSLVKKGLRPAVQQALDIVRLTGNKAVHPGEISWDEDGGAILIQMFDLINLIVDDLISKPAQVDALFRSLPEEKRLAIERRDGSG